MAIRATDDEQLARQLWGDNCVWVEERQQFVPDTDAPAGDSEFEEDETEAQDGPETYEGDEWGKDRLVEEARGRGLPVTGNKPELAQRLREDDELKAAEVR